MGLKEDIQAASDRRYAKKLQRFFKTGKGEYGEGDVFLGIRVGECRKIAKKHEKTPKKEKEKLLKSRFHEERLTGLLMLVEKFKKGTRKEKQEVFEQYLKNTRFVNNWDLVDLTAEKIVGAWLVGKNKKTLHFLANSENVWERRISIVSCFAFIKKNRFSEALKISKALLHDEHDLIHKAVGWMLREIGKRDRKAEEKFLKKHYNKMPRTMLRYAIEQFPEPKRKAYLQGTV